MVIEFYIRSQVSWKFVSPLRGYHFRHSSFMPSISLLLSKVRKIAFKELCRLSKTHNTSAFNHVHLISKHGISNCKWAFLLDLLIVDLPLGEVMRLLIFPLLQELGLVLAFQSIEQHLPELMLLISICFLIR